MNISDSIWSYALTKHLGCVATGGGFDYVMKEAKDEDDNGYKPCIILSCSTRDGSPKRLSSPSIVSYYPNQNWCLGVHIPFKTAREAMDYMAKMFFTAE